MDQNHVTANSDGDNDHSKKYIHSRHQCPYCPGKFDGLPCHVREKHPEKCTNQRAGKIVGILGIQKGTQPRMRCGVPCCFAVTNNICMHMKMHKDIFEDKQKN